jgi:hypothetical protein
MLIGICGLINSGKDTAADYLISEYNFKKDSFASTLKDILSVIFGWDRNMLEGDTEKSREWRNKVDEWWSTQLNIQDFTPRKAMQLIGTDCIRNHFNNNMWVLTLLKRFNRIDLNKENIVITDCRFPSEINAIRQKGGIIIRIIRTLPVWYDIGKDASLGCPKSIKKCKELGIHPSEYEHLSENENYTIYNDGTVEELKRKIDKIIKEISTVDIIY